MKKQYILLKDSPELKKGAILVEEYDEGNQDFNCLDRSSWKQKDIDFEEVVYSRNTIMKNPDWFQEIYPVYLTKEQLKKVEKLLGIKKEKKTKK